MTRSVVPGRLRHRPQPQTVAAASFTPAEGREVLRGHLIDQYQHHFHLTISIFKGITLGAAAFAFLAILASGRAVGGLVQWTAISYWAAGLFVVISSYDGMMVDSLIAVAAPNVFDVVLPFLLSICEFVLFAILNPQFLGVGSAPVSPESALRSLAWWPLAATCLTALGLVFMSNTQGSLTRTIEELPPEFHGFIRWFKGAITKNQWGSAFGGVITLLLFLMFRYGAPDIWLLGRLPSPERLRRWQGLLGPVVMFGAISGILSEEKARQRFVAIFSDAVPGGAAPADPAPAEPAPADAPLHVAGVDEA